LGLSFQSFVLADKVLGVPSKAVCQDFQIYPVFQVLVKILRREERIAQPTNEKVRFCRDCIIVVGAISTTT
jgi:hypothetical protein